MFKVNKIGILAATMKKTLIEVLNCSLSKAYPCLKTASYGS